MKRTKHSMKKNSIRCPYCGALAELRPVSEIYADPSRKDLLYVCRNYPGCRSYVSVQLGTNLPAGPLANGELRNLRIRAHRAFDQLWQQGLMTRSEAYRWMADFFCLPLRDAHIGMFSEYRCTELIKKCSSLLSERRRAAS